MKFNSSNSYVNKNTLYTVLLMLRHQIRNKINETSVYLSNLNTYHIYLCQVGNRYSICIDAIWRVISLMRMSIFFLVIKSKVKLRASIFKKQRCISNKVGKARRLIMPIRCVFYVFFTQAIFQMEKDPFPGYMCNLYPMLSFISFTTKLFI